VADAAALYLGLISGTSADGIDAALVACPDRPGARPQLRAARTFAYPDPLRRQILALAGATAALPLDALGELDVAIGRAFADAALALLGEAGIAAARIRAIGSHGQTLRHRPGGRYPFSLQVGDAAVIAERTGITTVADFRRADIAAGGQGAPLLPALHAAVFADPVVPRVVLNLGGIANLTVLVPGEPVTGFDTGPANCLLDAWAERHLGTPHDAGGAWARSGRVRGDLLASCLADPWLAAPPPKSSGREVFNLDWLQARLPAGIAPADVQATLLAFSARSIARALAAFAPATREVYACGGGIHNGALMAALRAELAATTSALSPQPSTLSLHTTAALGLDPDFVEAAGFAWLARARLGGLPGNLPSVTGARGPRLLGAIHAAPPRY
jgi:anhydro-N-acetylmuramic acid kinase